MHHTEGSYADWRNEKEKMGLGIPWMRVRTRTYTGGYGGQTTPKHTKIRWPLMKSATTGQFIMGHPQIIPALLFSSGMQTRSVLSMNRFFLASIVHAGGDLTRTKKKTPALKHFEVLSVIERMPSR